MRIEEVEALEAVVADGMNCADAFKALNKALAALRAEAWYPVEKAEELGAKDGREVRIALKCKQVLIGEWSPLDSNWLVDGGYVDPEDVTHFAANNPPEGA